MLPEAEVAITHALNQDELITPSVYLIDDRMLAQAISPAVAIGVCRPIGEFRLKLKSRLWDPSVLQP